MTMVRLFLEHKELSGVVLDYWLLNVRGSQGRNDTLSLDSQKMLNHYIDELAEVIDEGVKSGEFRPVAKRELAVALIAMQDGLTFYMSLFPDIGVDIEKACEVVVDLTLAGLRNPETKER